ncbi:hypothetical protein BCR34DRAFT_581049 [Clohesyomyces aquaticus]|uniref:FHA domain-containing protein n=1 Tax=Clohesyomyces aquaticus TaxID=1231657 RepID=A0A1Y1Y3N3_9PLEO|nr:hypothetical protein BCR34DRAFT_581049 [Clohesyomyces aquaticus]
MWILEHETLSGGKRVWLRPGTKLLYGRTKPGRSAEGEGKACYIDSKTVSRKHMTLQVSDVAPGDGTQLHSRTQVEITDLSGHAGTFVDEIKLLNKDGQKNTMILPSTEHLIKLGVTYPPFTIRWKPVVVTYASKESKSTKSDLHALGIKTASDFVYNKTTHVVSTKRNLPKVLQALVTGNHVVTGDFLDALIRAASPQNEDLDNYVPSRLEEDFDEWWPDETKYIPPVGAEPVERPDSMLEPDPARSEVFHGLTFVFLDEAQFNSLHDPIAGGGGKALLFNVCPGETTVDEYVGFVKNAAGQKRRARATGRLPVVTIRLSSWPPGMDDWAANFVNGVDQALNQRSILQNEFLDAIVSKDPSSLQKPPAETEVVSSMAAPTPNEPPLRDTTQDSQPRGPSEAPETTPAPEEPAKAIPRKRPNRRAITQSRFTGFDDYEPPTKSRKVEDKSMDEIQESEPVQKDFQETQSRSALATQTETQSNSVITAQSGRKRPAPVRESVEESEQRMNELFPAAAAMKRQRLATRGASASAEPNSLRQTRLVDSLQKPTKKPLKEIDVKEELRQRNQEEEERRIADEESLREQLDGVNISEIRDLVEIEEMEVRPRARPQRANQLATANNERWNDDWNGRKNFKKFRRRGVVRGPETQKVIVPFEEVPQKKGGVVGDQFFLEESQKRSKEDERRLARRTGRKRGHGSEPEPGFTRRKKRLQQQQQNEVINVPDSSSDDEDVFEEPARSGRSERVRETQIGETQTRSQTQTQTGTRKRGPSSAVAAGPSKRSKPSRRDEDSDEEETGFRFRRRG